MKDIDFDELDQAVSSVLGDTDTPEQPVESTVSTPAVSVAEPATASRATSVAPAAPRTVSPSLPSKRRGQFMDVVHPSSDMTTKNTMPSRSQPVIAPLGSSTPDDAPADLTAPNFAEPAPVVSEPTTETTSFDTTPPASQAHDWPDPLDVMSERETASHTLEATNEDVAKTGSGGLEDHLEKELDNLNATAPSSLSDTDEPAQTPFLDGTKVEKRPLGAFAIDEDDPLADDADTDTTSVQEAVPPPATLPPELDSKVVAVEEQHDSPTDADKAPEDNETAFPSQASAPLVAQSIPQQYAAQSSASVTATQPHPVFDTKEYHQPLLSAEGKPKKGKVGIIILIVVIMLALGAGLGFLAFEYGLI